MNLIKKCSALLGSAVVLGGSLVVATSATAHAENIPCPDGSGPRAIVDHNDGGVVYTSAEVCFLPYGDVFKYQDTHSEGMAGGMYYYSTDSNPHDHDYEYLWDTNNALNGWETLDTNESEGSLVYYRACLRQADGSGVWGCGTYQHDVA